MRIHEDRKAHVALRHGKIVGQFCFNRIERQFGMQRMFIFILRGVQMMAALEISP